MLYIIVQQQTTSPKTKAGYMPGFTSAYAWPTVLSLHSSNQHCYKPFIYFWYLFVLNSYTYSYLINSKAHICLQHYFEGFIGLFVAYTEPLSHPSCRVGSQDKYSVARLRQTGTYVFSCRVPCWQFMLWVDLVATTAPTNPG